ncbi:enolase C-terminal domain-like protein [Balneolales bacterium ANBcel1]|nr:enolase C-terminal domain-like protein [Balneolales bacterium ANBcel1]
MSKELTLYRYRLPFRISLRNEQGLTRHRNGVILGDGEALWTEIAPLPGFSTESLDDCVSFLMKNRESVQRHFRSQSLGEWLQDDFIAEEFAALPSVRFGLSMLAAQQQAFSSELPLYALLTRTHLPEHPQLLRRPDASCGEPPSHDPAADAPGGRENVSTSAGRHRSPAGGEHAGQAPAHITHAGHVVRCNGIVGQDTPERMLQSVKALQNGGFTTIKLKLPPSVREALDLFRTLHQAYPGLRFRLDANAAFSPDDAARLLEGLSEFRGPRHRSSTEPPSAPIEYIEEPLNRGSFRQWNRLRSFGIPIAADESARTADQISRLLEEDAVDAIVLKPTLYGSAQELHGLVDLVRNHNYARWSDGKTRPVSLVVSSALETSVGRQLLAHLAACVDMVLKPEAHGLATGHLFEADFTLRTHPEGVARGATASSHKSAASLTIEEPEPPNPEIMLAAEPGVGMRPVPQNR